MTEHDCTPFDSAEGKYKLLSRFKTFRNFAKLNLLLIEDYRGRKLHNYLQLHTLTTEVNENRPFNSEDTSEIHSYTCAVLYEHNLNQTGILFFKNL
jgi:hypothetical protein